MTRYSFQITNGQNFLHSEELASDAAAWHEAILTVRDIESTLSSEGGNWSLEVRRGEKPIFRIDVTARRIEP